MSPLICDRVKPGFFLEAGAVPGGAAASGRPPGSFIAARRAASPPKAGPARPGTAGADWKEGMAGLTGMRKLVGMPPGWPPRGPPGDRAARGSTEGPGLCGACPLAGRPVGGAPLRPRWTAWMRARMSWDTLRPLPRLDMVAGLAGRRAALILPSGVDEDVIPVEEEEEVIAVDAGRTGGAGEPWAGVGDEGLSEARSESKSAAGVEPGEAIAVVAGGVRR